MSATDTPDTGAVPPRLVTTAGAADLLRRLSGTHGELMMHQSGGCCDGSAPMCYPSGEFIVGDRDVLLGIVDLRLAVGETPEDLPTGTDAVQVWISGSQFEAWKHTQLVLDVVPGRGSGFSLESPEGIQIPQSSKGIHTGTKTKHSARRAFSWALIGKRACVLCPRRFPRWSPRPSMPARCRARPPDPENGSLKKI